MHRQPPLTMIWSPGPLILLRTLQEHQGWPQILHLPDKTAASTSGRLLCPHSHSCGSIILCGRRRHPSRGVADRTRWTGCRQAVSPKSKSQLDSMIATELGTLTPTEGPYHLCPMTDAHPTWGSPTNVKSTFFLGAAYAPLEMYFLCASQTLICLPPGNTVTSPSESS